MFFVHVFMLDGEMAKGRGDSWKEGKKGAIDGTTLLTWNKRERVGWARGTRLRRRLAPARLWVGGKREPGSWRGGAGRSAELGRIGEGGLRAKA